MSTRLAFLLPALALSACSEDPASPHGKLTGVFVLRSVNGAPLPALANGPSATEFRILADTIRLYADGVGTEVSVTSRATDSSPTKSTQELEISETGVNSFDIVYPCHDTIFISRSCIAPPHHRGTRTSAGLVLDYSVLYRTPLVFERLGGTND